jgi:tetratricopeptide (TPR) repeat protein
MQAGIFCLLLAFCSHIFSWEVESDPEPAPVPEARVIKKILPLSEEERANEAYMKAKQLLHSGPSGSAENALKLILQKTPEHVYTRALLASLYLKKENYVEAEKCLKQGLSYAEHPILLKTLAVVYEHQGKIELATALLEKVPYAHQKENTYIALSASFNYQKGDYKIAREQYIELLMREPNNPQWLLGVSMALEGEGASKAALEGFRKISQMSGLSADTMEYIQARIAGLEIKP